jgi:hypothetical protein
MYRVLRPVHPGLSQVIQSGIYADTLNSSFDPAAMLAAYPVTLTRLEHWAKQRVEGERLPQSRLAGGNSSPGLNL